MAKSDRVAFTCNGAPAEVAVPSGTSLLSVLREHLGVTSVKDGCAPQGQCGCCTVLVDGAPRVACVTPIDRVAGRDVMTIEGIDTEVRDALVDAFTATGASQCGFCTPGILVRASAVLTKQAGAPTRLAVDRALAAHLCRCTGWCTIHDAIEAAAVGSIAAQPGRDFVAASRRAELEGGVSQRVGAEVPLGAAGFADDTAPRNALVAIPARGDEGADTLEAEGLRWQVAESLDEARARNAKVQGRRTTVDPSPPITPMRANGGVVLATSWVEPAYLEPDASWCEPGGDPATPLANGGAFGGKASSSVAAAARSLADQLGRPVRVVFSREDATRLGPKRPPMSATAVYADGVVRITGTVAGAVDAFKASMPTPYGIDVVGTWSEIAVPGPPVSAHARAAGLAETVLLVEGALAEAGVERSDLVADARAAQVLLDTCAEVPSGALAGARVHVDPSTGAVQRVDVRVAAGDPLDHVVLRSYCIGAAHMALGWVLSEGLAVDPETGEVLDLTIRSFGVIRPKDTPPIEITIVSDPGEPRARASDAVFAAVAAAVWNAVTLADGVRPEAFPALGTRAARRLRA